MDITHMTPIPTTEPCPIGWVRERNTSDGRDYWINPSKYQSGTPINELTDGQKERIKQIQWAMREVKSQTLQEWIHNFSCDEHLEPAIQMHERIVRVYQFITKERRHTDDQKGRLYQFLLVLSTHGGYTTTVSAVPWAKGKYWEEAAIVYVADQFSQDCLDGNLEVAVGIARAKLTTLELLDEALRM